GTNAHIILEEAPEPQPLDTSSKAATERPLHLLALSSRGEPALQAAAERIEAHLANTSDQFTDVAYSANTGRAQLTHRLAVLAQTGDEARQKLRAYAAGEEVDDVYQGR